MDLNALKVFVKTVELRSFTGAAAALEMTQSGVSRAVSRLESGLGVKLMNRTTRSLTLTPDGQVFFDRCLLLLREFDEAEQQLVERRDQPTGVLKISSPLGFGRVVLLPVLVQLSKAYPSLIIEASLTDRMVDLTEEGFDAAIRVGKIRDSRMVANHLGIIRPVTIASPKYLKRFGKPKTPDELKQHNCLAIRFPRTGRKPSWQFVEDGRERKVSVTGNMVFDIGEALVDLAVLGHGIVQTQRLMAMQALANQQVVAVLEDYATDGRPVSLIYPQSRHLSAKIRVLNKALGNLSF